MDLFMYLQDLYYSFKGIKALFSGRSRISCRGGESRSRRCGLPRQLHFKNFVCKNERIGTLRGAARRARPLDPPMLLDNIIS